MSEPKTVEEYKPRYPNEVGCTCARDDAEQPLCPMHQRILGPLQKDTLEFSVVDLMAALSGLTSERDRALATIRRVEELAKTWQEKRETALTGYNVATYTVCIDELRAAFVPKPASTVTCETCEGSGWLEVDPTCAKEGGHSDLKRTPGQHCTCKPCPSCVEPKE